jgi:hypothetical protein
MKFRFAYLGLLTLAIYGCNATETASNSTDLPKIPITGLAVAEYSGTATHGLSNGKRIVPLGATRDIFMLAFPRPSRGFPLEDNVPGLPKEYQAEGWESEKEGAGIILNDGRITLVMHQYEALDAQEFADILKVVQAGFGDVNFKLKEEDKADYWFASKGSEWCVVSRLRGSNKTYQVTTTVGDKALMDFMGITKPLMLETEYAK